MALRGRETNRLVNMDNNKEFYCFLLGAGAEKDYGLPDGVTFKKETLFTPQKGLFHAINHKDGFYDREPVLFSPRSSSILYQTLIEEEKAGDKKRLSELLSDEERQTFQKYKEIKADPNSSEDKEDKKTIRDAFQDLYKKRVYSPLKEYEEKGEKTDEDIFIEAFFDQAKPYAFLDSLFNYLRRPDDYKKECSKVMRVYFSAFCSILSKFVLEDKPVGEALQKITAEQNQTVARERLLYILMNAKPQKLSPKGQSSYYEIINEILGRENVRVVTTNYTQIAQDELTLSDEDIAYLHGRIDLFEDLYTKKVDRLDKMDPDSVIFPFLFVQSGIKPLVCSYQYDEMAKFHAFAKESKALFVVGYGGNNDDDHINAVIRERLDDGKDVTIFVYGRDNNELENEKNKWRKALDKADTSHLFFENSKDFEAVMKKLS